VVDRKIEQKWQKIWENKRIFESDADPARKKCMVTVPFPYMNGPLHIGLAFTATRVDVYARFRRMQGFNTVFPWAFHWTGQPLVAAAERLSKGDPQMIHEFVEIDGIPRSEIHKFYDPAYMAQYYTDAGKIALKRLGLSIDWRREFHTTELEPTFNKFVIWQLNKLREMGFITRGTHPVVWCPRDQSPTGDHDRLSGEGVTWEEFTLVLFPLSKESRFSQAKLVAATFRPETIFGVTNLWLNPMATYVEIKVNDSDLWIVSRKASAKLADQLKKIEIIDEIPAQELIGQKVMNPLNNSQQLLILPAQFVDQEHGTGVVYSVPAHAPMDYVALRDLQRNESLLGELKVPIDQVRSITPISVIETPRLAKFPAVDIVEQMKIKDQHDKLIEKATAEIYKKEFHQGILNRNCGKYQSKKVSEVKSSIIEDLKSGGITDFLYDLPEKVVCRCTTECTVKILEDQWFLKYSDPGWKKLAHECIDRALLFPESTRQWYHDVIDWFKDWPCARRVGLGTPLEWSPGWIVETLSDSTIYPAFYTIRPIIRENRIDPLSLTGELFDFVFMGRGNNATVSASTGVPLKIVNEMRDEFLYWYPVDLRNSAKELIPNHLTFYVFQHVAFFSKELWPVGLAANGMMMNEGTKMSKSKGNVITLHHALDRFGADALRAALIVGAEGLDDLDWREKNVLDLDTKLNSLERLIQPLVRSRQGRDPKKLDQAHMWFENRIQIRISSVIQNLEQMKTKSAFQEAFYAYWNDFSYYLRRTKSPAKSLLRYAIETWIRLLAPFVPYLCEELNEGLGEAGLVSVAKYPEPTDSKMHPEAELAESAVLRLLEDARNIQNIVPQKLPKLFIYTSPSWQYDLLRHIISSREKGNKTSSLLQQFFDSHSNVEKTKIANALPKISRLVNELGSGFAEGYFKNSRAIQERNVYSKAKRFIAAELGVAVTINGADDPRIHDPKDRAKLALPFKPALYFE
jgi:leucyl-tRNA synthetase